MHFVNSTSYYGMKITYLFLVIKPNNYYMLKCAVDGSIQHEFRISPSYATRKIRTTSKHGHIWRYSTYKLASITFRAYIVLIKYMLFEVAKGGDKEKNKGATGVEPVTSRSAVECSATELYPHIDMRGVVDHTYVIDYFTLYVPETTFRSGYECKCNNNNYKVTMKINVYAYML